MRVNARAVAWFSAGCGLALLSVVGLRAVVDGQAREAQQSATPANGSVASDQLAPEPSSKLPWSEVPIQRPHRTVNARLPPLPLPEAARAVELIHTLDARLPEDAEATAAWNPNDARLPELTFFASAQIVRWNPDRATLPTAEPAAHMAQWDPDDARLPGLQ